MSKNSKNTNQSESQARFESHLNEASQIVKSWPAWKQKVLGANTAGQNSLCRTPTTDCKTERNS